MLVSERDGKGVEKNGKREEVYIIGESFSEISFEF